MLLCNGQIAVQQSKSAEIASAIERFLAQGNSICEIPSGVSGESPDAKVRARQFVINVPGKPKAEPTPKVKAPRKPRAKEVCTPAKLKSARIANETRARQFRERRNEMATKVAFHAGLGDSLSETAKALGVTRHLIRRICKEHNITFQDGRLAQ